MGTLLNSVGGVGIDGWAGRARRGLCSGLLGALAWCVLCGISPRAQAQGAVCQTSVMGIADACLWLKANDIAGTSDTPVRTWQDSSGNGKDLPNGAAATDSIHPTLIAGSAATGMNFNPVVRFRLRAEHQELRRTESSIGADVSEINVFFVSRDKEDDPNRPGPRPISGLAFTHSTLNHSRLTANWPGSDDDLHWQVGDVRELDGKPASANQYYAPAPFARGVANLGLVINSASANTMRIVVNAKTLPDTKPTDGRPDGEKSPGVRLVDGSLNVTVLNTSNLYDGDVSELLEFKRNLTSTERTRVQSYLALKYGLTLDRTELKDKAYTSGNDVSVYSDSDYWNNVIGIGRDDVTGLDQRVSRSTQKIGTDTLWVARGNSPLIIATSADFTSANGGSRRALRDGQYLVLGDNNSALDTFSADALGQRGNRTPRVWRVQNTPEKGGEGKRVNAVFLGFDPALLPDNLANAGDLYLLVSSDANFSAATTARYPLNRVTLGGKVFLTPVVEEGSSTPGVVNMLPGVSYMSLGRSSAKLCTGSPMGIANACAWYRADRGLDDNRNWPDQSGADNTAIANGSPSLTPNGVNFNATVDYRGGAGHTLPATADVTNHYTFLGLARMTGTHNGRAFSDQLNERLFGYLMKHESKTVQDAWVDSDGYFGDINYKEHIPDTAPQTKPMLYTLRRDANSASRFRSNGRTLSELGMSSTGKYRVALANGGLGLYNGAAYYADVSIPEFFSFKRALSDAEINRIESYLALKYGLTLDRTGLKDKAYTSGYDKAVYSDSNYWHSIIGLGHDSATTLDQRVAKSQEPGALLTLATPKNDNSADFTSTNGGTRRQLEPGQYLVLGDNNGRVDTLGAATAEQFGRRIDRVWRAQNTGPDGKVGPVGAVYLGFDPALLEANFPRDKPGFLLVSTDADFSVANTTRYALGRVTVGDKDVLTPVTDIGQSKPLAITIPNGISYITLGQESAVCTGRALGIDDACLWLKADDGGLTPGGTVSTWQDRSGSQKDMTGVGNPNPSVAAGSSAAGMNFNPVVRFNGVDQGVQRNESTLGTDVSEVNIFFVSRTYDKDTAKLHTIFFSHGDDRLRMLIHWTYDYSPKTPGHQLKWDRGLCCDKSTRNSSVAPFASDTPNLGLVTNSVEKDTAEIVVNARKLEDNDNDAVTGIPDAHPESPGVHLTGTYLKRTLLGGGILRINEHPHHGDVAEFLEFKRDLTPAERTRVQSYLALKYGLTLDRGGLAGNAYTSGSGTSVYSDSNYWNSIIGLGRDSVTKLDQRVSRSTQKLGPERDKNGLPTFQLVKGDSPLAIATSADFTSANGNHRPAENLPLGQYLVLGDNNGALDALNANAMGRNNNRLPRVWRARNTGVGPVFLGLEAAKVNFTNTGWRRLFVESGAGANGSFPVGRTSAYVLSNTLPGLTGYWVPVAANGAALAVDIPDGAYLSYGTLAEPQLSLSVQSRGGTGTFGFSGTNGFVASSAITRAEMQPVAASPATQTLSAPNVDIVITVTMPAAAGWRLEAASCIDRRAAASGNPSGAVLGRVSASDKFTIPAAQAKASADLHCTFVVRYDLGSTLNTISGRVFIDNGVGGGGVANDGKINGAETGRSGAALSLTNCGSGSTTIYAYTSSSGDGRYSLKVPPTVTNGPMCIAQTLIDDYRVTQGGLDASGADASGVTLDTTAAQRNRWRFNYAGASVQNLHIGNVPSSRLLVDGTRVGIAGSTVDFPHRLIAGTAGTLAFGVSDASPAASGWSEVLYRDFNCNAQLDAGEPLLGGSPTVEANEHVCVIVRQFVPAGLYEGATRQFQLQATLNWANAASRSETQTNRDHTQVSGQALRLYKEVRNVTADERSGTGRESWTTSNSAKPGETLEYRTTFTNLAPEPITKLEIYDATPNYTTLVSAECPAPLSLPAGLTCEPLSTTASPPTKPIDGGTGPLRWRFNGPLPGGAAGAVKYRVKVNE